MQNHAAPVQPRRNLPRPLPGGAIRIALDENELAARWGLSVKTLRRWRQEHLGPVFCKLGGMAISSCCPGGPGRGVRVSRQRRGIHHRKSIRSYCLWHDGNVHRTCEGWDWTCRRSCG
jgi:hypothetical protein